MRKFPWLAALLGLAALPARAQEVVLGGNLYGRWDSNVVSNPNTQADFSLRVGPDVHLREMQGDLTYDLHYMPTYQAYSRLAGLDSWEQYVNASGHYRIGSSTSMDASETFDYVPSASLFLQQLATPGAVTLGTPSVTVLGHINTLINTANVVFHQLWSELWSSDLIVSNQFLDPQLQNSISTNITGAQANLTYAFTPLDRIGGALGATVQQVGSNNVLNSSTTYFYNLSGIWNHQFSPTWGVQLQAGPTIVESPTVSTQSQVAVDVFPASSSGGQNFLVDFATCRSVPVNGQQIFVFQTCGPASLNLPVLSNSTPQPTRGFVPLTGQPASSGTSLTYFANLNTSKQWENLTFGLGFTRGAGLGLLNTSSISDTVTGSVAWTISPLWTATLSVLWTDQSSSASGVGASLETIQSFPYKINGVQQRGCLSNPCATPQVTQVVFQQQSSNINIYQWIIGAHVNYQITKRASVFANFFYLNQTGSSSSTFISTSGLGLTDTRVDLGFHYEFDPIHLR